MFSSCSDKEIKLTKTWETDTLLLSPESIVYDQLRGFLYVSNVDVNSKWSKEDTLFHEYISKVDLNGNIVAVKWIENICRPTGVIIFKDKLVITERNALIIANIDNGTVEKRIPIANAGFPNDVTVDDNGVYYVTDSGTKTVYRIENDSVEAWFVGDEIAAPNGILYDEGKLIIGVNSDNYLKSIDIKTKAITKIALLGEGTIDGIKKYGDDYLVSHVMGNIYLVKKTGEVKELLNTRVQEVKCADFEYIAEKKMILVPALSTNRVIGYQFQ
jgi:sugar lactone lactonase YvrE